MVLGLFLTTFICLAQVEPLPLEKEFWDFPTNSVEFKKEEGISKMKILPASGKVIAKDFKFKEGTIQFDVENSKSFSFFFRMKNDKELEYFYLRLPKALDPTAFDGIQYAPYINGILMWNTYPEFQSNVNFSEYGKNHFKFVISGSRMQVFVNSDIPALEVDHLAGNFQDGLLGFEGEAEISNLKVDREDMGNLTPESLPDPTFNDPGYIREWAVSETLQIPPKIEFSLDYLPSPSTSWEIIQTERRGFLNLTRAFGEMEGRRLNWLKVNIESEKDQIKTMDFGYLTEAWVYLNGQLIYIDKNLQGRPLAKKPFGRISVDNATVELSMKKGNNELLIGIVNVAWGTGAMVRFDNMENIRINPDPTFDSRLVKLSKEELKAFEGEYLVPVYETELTITSDDYSLIFESPVFNAIGYPQSDSLFFLRGNDLKIQFKFDSDQKVVGLELVNNGDLLLEMEKVK